MYDSYVITSSCREVVRRFQANYPGVRVLSREAVRLLVNKFRETGSILDKKRTLLMQKDSFSSISCDKVRLFFILKILF